MSPLLSLSLAGTPGHASAGTSYTLTLTATMTGTADHDPTLVATAPAGATFTSTPSPPGWTCAVTETSTVLTCTVSATPPVTGLSGLPVVANLTLAAEASGTLTTSATFSDTADGAASVTHTATVDVTADPVLSLALSGSPAGAAAGTSYTLTLTPTLTGTAYHEPSLVATVPPGEYFVSDPAPSGWTCALATTSTTLTCTPSATPPLDAWSGSPVTAKVKIRTATIGTQRTRASFSDTTDHATPATRTVTVKVTADPVLSLSFPGAPTGASSGATYTLTIAATATHAVYHDPVLVATLPTGETFTSTPTPAGWTCALTATSTSLTCTLNAMPPLDGVSGVPVVANVKVATGRTGTLPTTASVSDTADNATPAATTATLVVTADPVLALTASGTPSAATGGTVYTLTLTPTLTGVANHDPVLSGTLPSGETFTAAHGDGWSCAVGATPTTFTCSLRTATPFTGLAGEPVTATVKIATGSLGTLTSTVSLSDPDDQAAPVTKSASVTATAVPGLSLAISGTPAGASAGTSYTLTLAASTKATAAAADHDPSMVATLPSGETFAATPSPTGWSCARSGSTRTLDCTSTLVTPPTHTTPITPGTTLATVVANVKIATGGSGTLQTDVTLSDTTDQAVAVIRQATVTATADPLLSLTTSGTPTGASAGTSYTLTLSPTTQPIAGPVYHDPTLSATLATGLTFAAAPTPTGWDCSLSNSSKTLTCTYDTTTPVVAGKPMPTVTATVTIAPGASGTLSETAGLSDAADLASTATATASVTVTADPVLSVTTSGTPAGAAAGTDYTLTVTPHVTAGTAYHEPTVTAALASGETFGADPSPTGWTCSLADGTRTLSCSSSASVPIGAGTSLGSVTAAVTIGPATTGTLHTAIEATDTADEATPAHRHRRRDRDRGPGALPHHLGHPGPGRGGLRLHAHPRPLGHRHDVPRATARGHTAGR